MINVCNIFRPIDKKTGNFLLFSQYTRDLARSTTDSSYKIRPSRFICMNLNSNHISNMARYVGATNDLNVAIPKYFQNYFENDVAVVRDDGCELIGCNFSSMLFDRLAFMINYEERVELPDVIQYVGNIDLESWEDGFADIILDINSGASKTQYKYQEAFLNAAWDERDTPYYVDSDQFTTVLGKYKINSPAYICGWDESENIPIDGRINHGETFVGVGPMDGIDSFIVSTSSVFDQIFIKDEEAEAENSFTFNTVLILYDIIDNDNNIKETDIPLGLYFTGDVVNREINNPVTIYTSNDSVYGAGSGWSLRIATRFSPTPHGYLKVEEVALESGAIDESLSALMSANAEAIKTINSFADKSIYNSQTIKDMYAVFKNNRTNVPYIKTINGVGYWFVNGRNTGATITGQIGV